MKKALLIIGGLLLFILIALAAAPFLFKSQIKARVDAELAASLNAKTYYDANSFSLSFFRQFPKLTVSLEKFGIIGIDAFEGDTLANIGRFSAALDIMSVISGSKISISSIELDRPHIQAIRLADGRANWEVAKEDTTQRDTTLKEPTQFKVKIERWAITDGQVAFVDAQLPMIMTINDLDHEGNGDFTQDVFDLTTKTSIGSMSLEYDSVAYLTDKKISALLEMEINQPQSKYTFRDNELKVNEMGLKLNGDVQMKGEAIQPNITFSSINGNFRDLLSLVPGIYTKDFEGLKAEGEFDLRGQAQGTYLGDNLPRLSLNLSVKDGQFQYPSLPSAVTGVNMSMNIDHAQGPLENMRVVLNNLAMRIGKNPVTAKATIVGIKNMIVDGQVQAKLNLTEISQAFPMDGLTLKGLLNLNANAKGVYNAERKRLPAITADLNLLDGYVKSKKFPAPIERLNVQAQVRNATGRMEDTRINIPSLSMSLDGQPFTASALIENLVKYKWDIKAKGTLDLAKITKIYPIEGTKLAGILKADIATRGAMADVEAGRFDKLPTSGTLDLSQFAYKSVSMPQGATASTARLVFTPANMRLENFTGTLGKSDVKLAGSLSNYWAYILKGGVIKGQLAFNSDRFDANEWMSDEKAPKTNQPETPMKTVEVPRNIDFALNTTIGKLLYTNLDLNQVQGLVTIKDGVVGLENLRCNALDGALTISGKYDSRNLGRPAYNMSLKMTDVSVAKTTQAFNTIKKLAPIAEKLSGKMSTDFSMNGLLDEAMKPLFPTLQGGGTVNVREASLDNVQLISGLNKISKMGLPDNAQLRDLFLKGKIINGMLNFEPFDFKVGNQKLTLGGSNGFDQSINWDLKTALPAAAIGGLAGAASSIPGLNKLAGGDQPLDVIFKVTGTQTSPKLSFAGLGKSAGGGLKGAVTGRVKDEADKLKKEAEARARAEADKYKKEAEDKARQEADKLKDQAKSRAEEEMNKLKDKFKFPK